MYFNSYKQVTKLRQNSMRERLTYTSQLALAPVNQLPVSEAESLVTDREKKLQHNKQQVHWLLLVTTVTRGHASHHAPCGGLSLP